MLAAGAACFAEAQDYWTRNADLYYHMHENCGGGTQRVPISEKAARAFAKHACPVCVPAEDRAGDVQAAVRGGTIVVKFSDAWLREHELTDVFGWSVDSRYPGEEGWRMLGEYLHGDAYNAFVSQYMAEGSAEGRAYMPHILSADGALVMNERHIGSDWYIVVRPQGKFRNKWEMYWRVSSLDLHMEDGALQANFDLQTVEETRELRLKTMNSSNAAYSYAGDGFELQVYEALEGNVAVIREENADANRLENVCLVIGDELCCTGLSGYAEGDAAVYCCMLTDGELSALKSNVRAELWHVEHLTSDAYRVDMGDRFVYHSDADSSSAFVLEKINGVDPADHYFRMSVAGEPGCFAARSGGQAAIYDYTGAVRAVPAAETDKYAERITPLVWQGETGVFLAEYHKYMDYDPADRLFANGVEYGVRFGSDPEDEWGSYLCWLSDENGNTIGESRNQAFTIYDNGEVSMENLDGEIRIFDLFND